MEIFRLENYRFYISGYNNQGIELFYKQLFIGSKMTRGNNTV